MLIIVLVVLVNIMHKLIKTLNKFNGNICFAGSTDSGDYIFECDKQNHSLSYVASTKLITDVCLESESKYLVAFSNKWMGKYENGVLNETYINTGISSVDKIICFSDSSIYILNKVNNQLVKYDGGVIWTYDLPDYSLRYYGNISPRESDGCIVYYNNTNMYLVRDDATKASLIGSLPIDGSGLMFAAIGNENIPSYSNVRIRTVSGKEKEWSSSSSSISSSSSVSSSSSSSSSSYIELWSSSSSSSSSSSVSSLSSLSSLSSSGCFCTSFSCAGVACTDLMNWSINGVREGNSDNCTLYVKKTLYFFTNPKIIVQLFKQPIYTVDYFVAEATGEMYFPGPVSLTFTEQQSSGITGSVLWYQHTTGYSVTYATLTCVL